MKSFSQFRFLCAVIAAAAFALPVLVYPERISARGQQAAQDEVRGAPAEPTDAPETRAQIDAIEKQIGRASCRERV